MSVLDAIVARTRADLAARKRARPRHTFVSSLRRSTRSLEHALRAPRTGLILECKKASPSKGLIREDFDPRTIARAYAPVADAISVLTDAPYFQGSHEYLTMVRDVVDVPVLCKDFVVDPYQVEEARAFGADAILLMLSVVDDATWRACAHCAQQLSVDVLTEVHDVAELQRALDLGARILGVSNRDVKTLEVDRDVCRRLAPTIPDDRVLVCESGIHGHTDLMSVRAHVDASLVGSSIMSQEDLDAAVRELAYGRVKVCGLTRPEDAQRAHQAGASFGGVIFARASPRRVSIAQAREVTSATPMPFAGVFVEHGPEDIAQITEDLGLAIAQLHGDQDAAFIATLRAMLPEGTQIWRAHRVRHDAPLPEDLLQGADRVLCDTFDARAHGGTGKRFDWGRLARHPERSRAILSGGLDPEHIDAASHQGCWALDVNSGVEDAPGQKSHDALNALFAALRGPGRTPRTREATR
ncbi:MAG: bifunctional indole-3-glycerol-phosphate synthase TrpC/phosphoribosylanthranilate isomerase TrpF [Myxococcota bacterium]